MKSIGRYAIRDTLGRGAMGVVYKVVVPGIHKMAALKCLAPGPGLAEKAGMDRLREQFVREAATMAGMRHPHIVDVWSLEEAEGTLFYLMEYFCQNVGALIGESYWADRPSRIMQVERAGTLTLGVLDGLARLHHAGIVHRDIKPYNIMLTDAGVPKIADFGLSATRGEAPAFHADLLMGTRFYAAPEQAGAAENGGKVDHRADLYAAGVMLYRMLTGVLPQQPPVPAGERNPMIGAGWDALLSRAMDPDPNRRFPDAEAMSGAIRSSLADHRRHRQAACRMKPDRTPESDDPLQNDPVLQRAGNAPIRLRTAAGRIPAARARARFDLNNLDRPNRYVRNALAAHGDNAVIDHATGLIWQRGGSAYPMPWAAANAYVRELNDSRCGGYDRWRMPTVDELLSLLNPPPPGADFCLESLFSPVQKWIWSGDTRSVRASWVVQVEMGCVISSDVMNYVYAKGVCSLREGVG